MERIKDLEGENLIEESSSFSSSSSENGQNDEDKSDDKTVINEELNEIVDKTFDDFSKFFKITPTKQVSDNLVLCVITYFSHQHYLLHITIL